MPIYIQTKNLNILIDAVNKSKFKMDILVLISPKKGSLKHTIIRNIANINFHNQNLLDKILLKPFESDRVSMSYIITHCVNVLLCFYWLKHQEL